MGSNHTYLAVINLDSALEKSKNYYPQVFLKECFYIEKKVIGHINDNFLLPMSIMKNRCFLINT